MSQIFSKPFPFSYNHSLNKSPNFADAETEPAGPGGSKRNLGLTVKMAARVQDARRRLAEHTEEVRDRINSSSPHSPEQQQQIAAGMQELEQIRNQRIHQARRQFSGEELEHAMRMIHGMHDHSTNELLAKFTAPSKLAPPEDDLA